VFVNIAICLQEVCFVYVPFLLDIYVKDVKDLSSDRVCFVVVLSKVFCLHCILTPISCER